MTFTTAIKEEISKNPIDLIDARYELEAFLRCSAKIDEKIIFTLENASVARRIYKELKMIYGINPTITVRNQRRFRIKQIYIITVVDSKRSIISNINLDILPNLDSREEKISFIRGTFLAIGNISNPQTSGYHLEFICNSIELAQYISKILGELQFTSKIIKRGTKEIVYIKLGEQISDLIKLFKAPNALFFFEDIRIYRDHKNMVNRLNNCELSNQTKTIETGLKQLEDIKYVKNNDIFSILEEKTKIVLEAREKYPEVSLNELAQIITMEYNYKIGKSGVNHHFIKLNKIVENHKKNNG